ncbi:MAG: hypothetical protein KDA25_03475, partial [Phycisphaerales bacterium]|nr:hypothetical protein [Phycisphaerales bacterium]
MAHHSWSGLGVALLFMVGGAGADDAVMLPPTWVAYEAGRTVHAETAETVIVAPDGVVTMVGTAWLPSTSDDVLVARYGPDGTPL